MTKHTWKNLILEASENIGLLDLFQRFNIGNGQYVYVLTYHRVAEPASRPWLYPGLISAVPKQFELQMQLVSSKYNPISVKDLMNVVQDGRSLPENAVLLTVDDGYRDFQEEIFPICSRYGIQPLLFIPTAFVGSGNFWWDKVYQIIHFSGQNKIDTLVGEFPILTADEMSHAFERLIHDLKRMPFQRVADWVDSTHSKFVHLTEEQQQNTLTWDELHHLSEKGVTVACHTHSHPIMTQIPLDEARNEVRISQALIHQELGNTLPIFSFPDGKPLAFTQDLFEMLYEEGFLLLFILVGGRARIRRESQKMILPRLSVWQSQTLSHFHLRMTPVWNLIEAFNHWRSKLFM